MDDRTRRSGLLSGSKQEGSFDAPQDLSVLALALSASQALRALIGLKLTPLGLASGQDRFLIALDDRGPMSISSVADALRVRPSTVSKMMDRLETRGYAVRTRDELDARKTTIDLTDEGRAVCKKIRALNVAIETELLADLSVGDREHMIKGIGMLNDVVGRRLKRLR